MYENKAIIHYLMKYTNTMTSPYAAVFHMH